MPFVRNTTSEHKILYLPKRTLRFRPKQIKELHKYEVDCERFQNRLSEFRVLAEQEEKEETTEQEEIEELAE